MKISIITVCFNSAETISDTLNSVQEQSYGDIEHIVIDGGSTDNTLAIVAAKGSHVARLESGVDDGIYDAMNKGLALATGEIVGFLNSDDVLAHPEVIAKIAQALENPSIDSCYGDLVYVAQHDMNKIIRYWKSGKFKSGGFLKGWVPAHPTFYARRLIYEKFGVFDLNIQLAADFDILLRFFEVSKISSEYIPEVLVKMRLGGATNVSWGSIIKQNGEIAKIFQRYGFSVGPKLFAFRFLKRIAQFLPRPSLHE